MTPEKRIGQHESETSIEYLRRVVSNCNYEPESILQRLPSVEAVCEYFDLWAVYDTDFWAGILEQIAEGAPTKQADDFCAKYGLTELAEDISDAMEARQELTA